MKWLVLIGLLWLPISVRAETLYYDIMLAGLDVGDLSISKKTNGTLKTYYMKSTTKVVGREDVCTGSVKFDNGKLISSSLQNKKNGKTIFYCYVTKPSEKGYKIQTEKGLSTMAGSISACCYDLFFAEPNDGSKFFSERWGKFGSISWMKEHCYKLIVEEGDNYVYEYEGGKLVKMETPTPVGNCNLVIK